MPNSDRETDPNFRKTHIDYKPVLFNAARRGGKGNSTPDILSPKGLPGAGTDADIKKRSAAAGLFNRQAGKPSGKRAGKG